MNDYNRNVVYVLLFLVVLLTANLDLSAQILDNGCEQARFGVDADLYANGSAFGNIANRNLQIDDWFYDPQMSGAGIGILETTNTDLWSDPAYIASNPHTLGNMIYDPNTIHNGIRFQDGLYARDYYGGSDQIDLTSYISASKNGENPADWDHGPHSVTPKNDIIDCYAHLRRNGVDAEADLMLMAGFSRISNSGQSYLDLELFANLISYNPQTGFPSGGPDDGHQAWTFDSAGNVDGLGDLIVAVVFNTGSPSEIDLRIWVSRDDYNNVTPASFNWGTEFNGARNNSNFGYANIRPKSIGDFGCGLSNENMVKGPPWGTLNSSGIQASDYESNQFLEIGINLSKFGIDTELRALLEGDKCWNPFGSILFKARASASFTAQLKDFSGPYDFGRIPEIIADIKEDTLSCITPEVILHQRDTYISNGIFYEWETTDGHFIGRTDSSHVVIDAPGTYILHASAMAGCAISSDTVNIISLIHDVNAEILPDTSYGCSEEPFFLKHNQAVDAVLWILPDGSLAGGDSILADQHGLYEVQMRDQISGCYDIDKIWVDNTPCIDDIRAIPEDGNLALVLDTTAPTILSIPDTIISCMGNIDDLDYSIYFIDECDTEALIVTYNDSVVPNNPCEGSAVITRTWYVEDACGNQTESIQTITLSDTIPPVFETPADITLSCDVDVTDLALTGTVRSIIDDCSSIFTTNHIDSLVSNEPCIGSSTIYRTWKVSDACGNEAESLQIIELVDETAPVFTVPADIDIDCNQDPADLTLTGELSAIMDNCADEGLTIDYTDVIESDQPCLGAYRITRTWTVSDDCGNLATQQQIITVSDNEGPQFSAPPTITISCAQDPDDLTITGDVDPNAIVDDCDSSAKTASYTDQISTQGMCSGNSTILRIWMASDDCENIGRDTQYIYIEDDLAPTFTSPEDITISCDQSPDDLSIVGDVLDESDLCDTSIGQATYSDIVSTDGLCRGSQIITRTWSLTDDCGNTTDLDQIITVIDTTPPTIIFTEIDLPAIECDTTHAIPEVGVEIIISDNCDTDPTYVFEERHIPKGSCNNEFWVRRVWTVSDDCGNIDSLVQEFLVQDTENPIVMVFPPDHTLACHDPIPEERLSIDDNCDIDIDIVLIDEVVPGDCPNSYTLIRKWTWTDNCGNAENYTQHIEIIDNEAPNFDTPPDTTVTCDLSSFEPAVIGSPINIFDNCDVALAAPTFSDRIITTGQCSGNYIIQRAWELTDQCGNTTIKNQVITVIDTVPPTFDVPQNITLSCSADPSDLSVTGTITNIQDNCTTMLSSGNYQDSIVTAGYCNGSFQIIRTWTLVDDCGNTATAIQEIDIIDEEDPFFIPPNDITILCTDDPYDLILVGEAISENDGCDDTLLQATYSDVIKQDTLCGGAFVIFRTWELSDDCNNTITHTQTITIEDTTAPVVLTALPDTVFYCQMDPDYHIDIQYEDCSNIVEISHTQDTVWGACDHQYTITREWSIVDDCGHRTSETQTFVIYDSIAPVLSVYPRDTIIDCDQHFDPPSITALDECSGDLEVLYTTSTERGLCSNQNIIARQWVATDNCGNVTVHEQIITVNNCRPAVELDQNPDQVHCLGATVTFEVSVGNEYDTPEYQWQHRTSSGQWENLSGQGSSRLIIENITLEDTGAYRCLVSNSLDQLYDTDCNTISDISILEIHDAVPDTNIDGMFCPGEPYVVDGRLYNTAGIYFDTLNNYNGCDSVVVLTLQELDIALTQLYQEICQGESFTFNQQEIFIDGIYYDTLRTVEGCDSLVRLDLNVLPTYVMDVYIDECSSVSTYTNDTTVVDSLSAISGCDSIVYNHISIVEMHLDTIYEQHCYGDLRGDLLLHSDTMLVDSLLSVTLCDSVVWTAISVIPQQSQVLEVHLCEGETFYVNDTTITSTSNYVLVTVDDYGCAITTTYNVTVHPNYIIDRPVEICFGQTWRDIALSRDTTISDTYQSARYCDSTINHVITVTYLDTLFESYTTCAGEAIDGQLYPRDTTFTYSLIDTDGCIQPYEQSITILDTFGVQENHTICFGDTLFIHGQQYTDTGHFEIPYATADGCDSLVRLDLNVLPIYAIDIYIEECSSVSSYTSDTMVVDSLYAISGCDSIVYNHISIVERYLDTIYEQRCYGDLRGDLLLHSDTILVDSLLSVTSCDSVVWTAISVIPQQSQVLEVHLCEGETFSVNDTTITSTSNYVHVTIDDYGCAITTTYNVTVHPNYIIDRPVEICYGQTWRDIALSRDTTISDTYQSARYCDSTINHVITVTYLDTLFESFTTCAGEAIDGQLYPRDTTFTYSLIDADGCIQPYRQTITILDTFALQENHTICLGDTLFVHGNQYTESGGFDITYTTVNGCDSTIYLSIERVDLVEISLDTIVCAGATVEDVVVLSDTSWVRIQNGDICPVEQHIHVQIKEPILISKPTTICAPTVIEHVHVDTDTSFVLAYGCDSLITYNILYTSVEGDTISESICAEDPTLPEMVTADNNIVRQTRINADGCTVEDIYEYVLLPSYDIHRYIELCYGGTFNGTSYFRDTTTTVTYPTVAGCDSTVHYRILIEDAEMIDTIDVCLGAMYQGIMINGDTTLTQQVALDAGCWQKITTYITAIVPTVRTSTLSLCAGDEFNGVSVDQDTTIRLPDPAAADDSICPSWVDYHIDVTPLAIETQSFVFCEIGTYNGVQFTQDTTIIERSGCQESRIVIDIHHSPEPYLETIHICEGDSTLVFGEWITRADVFQRTIQNGNMCDSTVTIEVIVETQDAYIMENASICPDGEAQLFIEGAAPDLEVYWSPSTTLSCDDCLDPMAFPSQTTTYHVEYANGCNDRMETETVTVEVRSAPAIQFVEETMEAYIGDTVILMIAQADSTRVYQWYDDQNKMVCHNCTQMKVVVSKNTTYSIVADRKQYRHCPIQGLVHIQVSPKPCELGVIHVNNVLFPELDDYGSLLEIHTEDVEVDLLRIYNRWGELIFETDDTMRKWDGTYKGIPLDPDVYVYYISGVCDDLSPFIKTGNITLIR